jgi:hypothetical protein
MKRLVTSKTPEMKAPRARDRACGRHASQLRRSRKSAGPSAWATHESLDQGGRASFARSASIPYCSSSRLGVFAVNSAPRPFSQFCQIIFASDWCASVRLSALWCASVRDRFDASSVQPKNMCDIIASAPVSVRPENMRSNMPMVPNDTQRKRRERT